MSIERVKKEMLMGEMVVAGKKELSKKELVERRQEVVERLMLARMSVRQIQAELARLAKEGKGEACSRGTVSGDMKAVRERWAAVRQTEVDQLVGEEVARLEALERRWWDVATGEGVDPAEAGAATDRVMGIIRQRVALLGLGAGSGKGSVQVTAGAMASAGGGQGGVNTEGPLPAGAQVKVLVTYVDDRRDL